MRKVRYVARMHPVPDRTPPVMQRQNERRRINVVGGCTDDASVCTVVVIEETSGAFAIYPHGVARFGVRLPGETMRGLCRDVLDGGPRPAPEPWETGP